MATIILGTAGQIFGGPIGGLIGTAIGGALDRNVFGGSGRPRERGRTANPALQSATYGEPIPIIVGRMRTAGNLIWSSGIAERSATSGGSKSSGPTSTSFSYAASFAVGLVAGPIAGIGRVWADGKLIRASDGTFMTPTVMRLHAGSADQLVDPLIAAAQGPAGTPAFRGMAYVVFEDMPLGDYGNRIPNLTFEVMADDATIDAGMAMIRIAAIAGYQGLTTVGPFPALTGYMVGRATSLADALAPLLATADASLTAREGLAVVAVGDAIAALPTGVGDARRQGDSRPAERQRRASADAQPGSLELAYYDPDRDYQPGLTRVRSGSRPAIDQRSIAAAMTPETARRLVIDLLAKGEAARFEQTIRLPWRWLELVAGDTISVAASPGLWRIRERRFENFVVHLDLVRVRAAMTVQAPEAIALRRMMSTGDGASGATESADPIAPIGATQLHILDLPALPGDPADRPRLWIAANSDSARWRRAGVSVSLDAGASYTSLGAIVGGTVIGTMLTALAPGSPCRWDRFGVADVELISDRDWLEGRSEAAVLAGGNLALVGDELIQFVEVEPLAPQRFRLRGLLRGRRGTEAAVRGHCAGERFVLIDPARMLPCDPPLDALGRALRFVATGHGDADMLPFSTFMSGVGLRPLSPCRLRVRHHPDGLAVTWVRRSRAGYGWHDFVDAPLGETAESYAVTLCVDGRINRRDCVTAPAIFIPTSRIVGHGTGQTVDIEIAQNSMIVGPGLSASISVTLTDREIA